MPTSRYILVGRVSGGSHISVAMPANTRIRHEHWEASILAILFLCVYSFLSIHFTFLWFFPAFTAGTYFTHILTSSFPVNMGCVTPAISKRVAGEWISTSLIRISIAVYFCNTFFFSVSVCAHFSLSFPNIGQVPLPFDTQPCPNCLPLKSYFPLKGRPAVCAYRTASEEKALICNTSFQS